MAYHLYFILIALHRLLKKPILRMAANKAPVVLEFVSSPNRYGLPAHFELHVWAWRGNPQGAFVD